MRTEYTVKIYNFNGKQPGRVDWATYSAKKYAVERYEFYKGRGVEVELYKVVYYGNSFHHAEKIM